MNRFLLLVVTLICSTSIFASDFLVDGLNYTILSDNEVEVSGFSSASVNTTLYNAETLSLPSTVEYAGTRYSVVSIGYSAFSFMKTGNIYKGRFTSVSIPASIRTIGDYAFYYRDLVSVKFHEGLTLINQYAFASTNLTEIELPQSLETISNSAFRSTKIAKLCLNCNSIGDYAFSFTTIETLSIGENVKSIGNFAFYKCQQLSSLEIPGTVKSIGDEAFSCCKNVVSLKVLEDSEPLELGAGSFQFLETIISQGSGNNFEGYEDDSALESMYIARQYKAINEKQNPSFFSNASKLTTLILAGELKDILPGSFWYLPNLTALTIPANIERLSYDSFLRCPKLLEWVISTDNKPLTVYSDGLTLNNGANWSFNKATIGRQVETTTDNCGSMFPLCLESVVFTGEFKHLNEATKLTSHNNVVSVDFQCNLESICADGLAGTNITNLTLPNTVTALGFGAFRNCKSLTQFTNSDNVVTIPEQAFSNCSSLSSIHVGELVETVSSQVVFH